MSERTEVVKAKLKELALENDIANMLYGYCRLWDERYKNHSDIVIDNSIRDLVYALYDAYESQDKVSA